MFRSIWPGFTPWFLEAQEARFLTCALEQILDVAPRFKSDPSLRANPEDQTYLVRVSRRSNGTLVWEDSRMRVALPEPVAISLQINIQDFEKLRRLPKSRVRIEVDFFMLPSAISEKGERPYFPYILLMVETKSGMVVGTDLLNPKPSLEAMWGLFPGKIVEWLAKINLVPDEIAVRLTFLTQLLEPIAVELRFKIKESRNLPGLDSARNFLFQNLM